MNSKELSEVARHIRRSVLTMSYRAGTPHIGSSLSCIEILTAAYFSALRINPEAPEDEKRDRFILSKGHAIPALYATLACRGYFPESRLEEFAVDGSQMTEQPSPHAIPGVELATGSLGHGLSVGLGMALTGRIAGAGYRVYVTLSDGECNEGSIWEAALFAAAQRLSNVVAIIDFNKWQATGRSREVLALDPLREKWESFGWSAYEVDGHDLDALSALLRRIPDGSGKPVAVVAHTVKGRGVSFMEDDNNWHYRTLDRAAYENALKELGEI